MFNKKIVSLISATALSLSMMTALPVSAADTIVTSPQINLDSVIADNISILSDIHNNVLKNSAADNTSENTAPNNPLCTAPNILINGILPGKPIINELIPMTISKPYPIGVLDRIQHRELIDSILAYLNEIQSVNGADNAVSMSTPSPDLLKPVSTPTPKPTSTTSSAAEVITLVNRHRADAGLKPLTADDTLNKIAAAKASDMSETGILSHESERYGDLRNLHRTFGARFSTYGENIACGQSSAAEVVDDWMNSSGHRANILSSEYTKIGVASSKAANGTIYWVQEFGG